MDVGSEKDFLRVPVCDAWWSKYAFCLLSS